MPYKLRKAPKRDLYWVISTETKQKHSKEPLPLEKAKAQMKALYVAMGKEDYSGKGIGQSKAKVVPMTQEEFEYDVLINDWNRKNKNRALGDLGRTTMTRRNLPINTDGDIRKLHTEDDYIALPNGEVGRIPTGEYSPYDKRRWEGELNRRVAKPLPDSFEEEEEEEEVVQPTYDYDWRAFRAKNVARMDIGSNTRHENRDKFAVIRRRFKLCESKGLDPELCLPENVGKYRRLTGEGHIHILGAGIWDIVKDAFNPQKVYNEITNPDSISRKRISDVAKGIRTEYPPSSRKVLEKYGDWNVVLLQLRRDVVQSAINKAFNIITLGAWNKAKSETSMDKLFHLGLVVGVKNIATGQQHHVICEKNEVINIGELQRATPETEFCRVATPQPPRTLLQFLQNAQSKAQDFFKYDPFGNNCQDFVAGLLEANGVYSPQAKTFVKQNVDSLLKRLPGYTHAVARGITDLGALANVAVEGAGKCQSNLRLADDDEECYAHLNDDIYKWNDDKYPWTDEPFFDVSMSRPQLSRIGNIGLREIVADAYDPSAFTFDPKPYIVEHPHHHYRHMTQEKFLDKVNKRVLPKPVARKPDLPKPVAKPTPTLVERFTGLFKTNPVKGEGKAHFTKTLTPSNPFKTQLEKEGIESSSYLEEARRRAKEHHYPYKLLGFASDGKHKLAIPDKSGRMVAFGKVGYGDHIIYSHLEKHQKVPMGTADAKKNTFHKSHTKMKGAWASEPFSPNNLALRILW